MQRDPEHGGKQASLYASLILLEFLKNARAELHLLDV